MNKITPEQSRRIRDLIGALPDPMRHDIRVRAARSIAIGLDPERMIDILEQIHDAIKGLYEPRAQA